jgi:glycosyltransferase involved in cell wall biosynthesis
VSISFQTENIAVILPAFNEAATISLTMQDFSKVLPNASYYLIDNNCTDETVFVASNFAKNNNLNFSVIIEPLQGKGNAVRNAFLKIDADVYVLVDSDFTYPAMYVKKMIEILKVGGFSMVVGDRLTDGSYSKQNNRQFHDLGNVLITSTINILFRAKVRDVLSGYRVMTRDFVKNLPILGAGFELETEITLHALDKKFSFREFPIEYKSRPEGSISKLHTFRDGVKVVRTILKLLRDYRPLKFFMSLSSAPALLGLLFGLQPILDYLQYRFVSHVPLAILSASLEICALLLVAIGIILQNLNNVERRMFELSRLHGSFLK